MMRTIFAWVAGFTVLGIIAMAVWLYEPDKQRAALEEIYAGEYRIVDGVRLRLRDTGPTAAQA
ncbi:MAG: alpha/beta hydrolase, partial [Alphaproteobacteria bacterium]|nr:alpha/beta hydrolase [Alphaproteobacteria bacterium]